MQMPRPCELERGIGNDLRRGYLHRGFLLSSIFYISPSPLSLLFLEVSHRTESSQGKRGKQGKSGNDQNIPC